MGQSVEELGVCFDVRVLLRASWKGMRIVGVLGARGRRKRLGLRMYTMRLAINVMLGRMYTCPGVKVIGTNSSRRYLGQESLPLAKIRALQIGLPGIT